MLINFPYDEGMMTFKTATQNDVNELSIMVNSAYRGESSKVGWTTEADLLGGQRTDPEKLLEMIENPNSEIQLAIQDGKILGCVYINQEKDFLYFGMLTVNPNLQNKGLGKTLLKRVEEIAFERKIKKIKMTVINVRKELIAFYERRGYQWTGETEPFPEGDPRFGLPKQKLIFNVYEKVL